MGAGWVLSMNGVTESKEIYDERPSTIYRPNEKKKFRTVVDRLRSISAELDEIATTIEPYAGGRMKKVDNIMQILG